MYFIQRYILSADLLLLNIVLLFTFADQAFWADRISEGVIYIADQAMAWSAILFSEFADQANTAFKLLEERASRLQSESNPSEKKLKVISNLAQLSIPLSTTLVLAGVWLSIEHLWFTHVIWLRIEHRMQQQHIWPVVGHRIPNWILS